MYENLKHGFSQGNGTTTACAMSLAYLKDCERRGMSRQEALAGFADRSECVSNVVCRYVIKVNDCRAFWPDNDEATTWMHSIAPRLLDTQLTTDVEVARAYLCADAAVRIFAPLALGATTGKWPQAAEHAAALRALAPVVDAASAAAAADYAARAADYAANGAARAADYAASAAYYAANGFHTAAANAAALATTNAADYAATEGSVKSEALALLDRLIECGRRADLTLQMLNALPQDDRFGHIEEANRWLHVNRPSIGMHDRADVVAAWVYGEKLA